MTRKGLASEREVVLMPLLLAGRGIDRVTAARAAAALLDGRVDVSNIAVLAFAHIVLSQRRIVDRREDRSETRPAI